MSIYDARGNLQYTYRIDSDNTGGKEKYWVVRIKHYHPDSPASEAENGSAIALPDEQRISRHDSLLLADKALTQLKRLDMGG